MIPLTEAERFFFKTDHAEVGVDHDNIWLVQGVSQYSGTERPVNATDSFLLPNFLEPQR